MPTIARKRTKADQRREQQRVLLFPTVAKEELWSSALNGWCWVPRSMPLVLQAIRCLSKGASAAETYFALWCNCVSESVVDMNNMANLIAAAGYRGPTRERTWRERMKKLEELHFIKIAPGKHGDISCVLLLNPHKALQRHKELGTAGFDDTIYNCILETIADYGMLDFKDATQITGPPSPHPVPPPPRGISSAPATPVPPPAAPASPVAVPSAQAAPTTAIGPSSGLGDKVGIGSK